MKKFIKQALYDLRTQPVLGSVTLIGTALSIFLIMVVVMLSEVKVMPFGAEQNRNRTLHGWYIHTMATDTVLNKREGSASMSIEAARTLYADLKSAEAVTFYNEAGTANAYIPGKERKTIDRISTDDSFFKVFTLEFLAGRGFTPEESADGAEVVVICESLARSYFGEVSEAIGKTIYINFMPYKITGVVADVPELNTVAYAQAWTTLSSKKDLWNDGAFGEISASILARSASAKDMDAVKEEVQMRKKVLDSQLRADGTTLVDHGQPWEQERIFHTQGSNNDPNDKEWRKMRLTLYAILLLLPAINLSTMTQSRLSRRRPEIGVRRAFGATRKGIVGGIILENFFITLIGSAIGLLLCIIVCLIFSNDLFNIFDASHHFSAPLEVLVNWRVFGMALLFCFILNLLSSGIPAWRSARTEPVNALNNR